MKRFSKIFSSSTETPSAVQSSAIICACRSVGKPGKGSVVTSTAFTRPFLRATFSPRLVWVTLTPAASSFSAKLSTRSSVPPMHSTSPPQIAGTSM